MDNFRITVRHKKFKSIPACVYYFDSFEKLSDAVTVLFENNFIVKFRFLSGLLTKKEMSTLILLNEMVDPSFINVDLSVDEMNLLYEREYYVS
jgi:hypothetical protein